MMNSGPANTPAKAHDRIGEGGKRLTGHQLCPADNSPVITVVTVVFNDATGLEKTISSVRIQRYPHVEHIVIDAGSQDGTREVLQRHNADLSYWVSEPDDGIYDAMNKGINLASGDIIGILNAGDTYTPEALDTIARYAKSNPRAQFIFGSVIKGKLRSQLKPWKIHWSFDFYTCHSVGFFIRTVAQHQVGLYNTTYRCSADYDLFYRMLVKHRMRGIVTKPTEIIGTFELGGFSERMRYLDHLFEETRIRLDNGQHRLCVLFIFLLRYLLNIRRI